MPLPTVPRYPNAFDGDDNLYLVHDALRLKLLDDYNPGDAKITVTGDAIVVARIPESGQITLTEQCSDLPDRAISFHYTAFDAEFMEFSGLTLLPGFNDVKKYKDITNVTVNVMSDHHNNLKDTLVALQKFCGVKGTKDKEPFGETLEGRINFLREIVLQPKAWFTSDMRTGNVPLTVNFKDQSFRLGTDGLDQEITLTWDFGDNTSSFVSSFITATSAVPENAVDVLVRDEDGGTIRKIYHRPGIYDVKLTVSNNFGSDTVIFPDFINARVKAPEPAIIRFVPITSVQETEPGVPPDGPFDTVPKIRSPINTLIQMEIQNGENPSMPGYSYAGELLDNTNTPLDPIVSYNWYLGDDLFHPNSSETKASYGVGGIYDLKLRVDTQYGAYRITTYEDSIDIIENYNLWLWIFTNSSQVQCYEFGLISETYKIKNNTPAVVNRNHDFLLNQPNASQQIREFKRNTGFAPRSTIASGQSGYVMLYYASGRNEMDPASTEEINVIEYQGFLDIYNYRPSIQRQWNWATLSSGSNSYFLFGDVPTRVPNYSQTNLEKQTYDLFALTTTSTLMDGTNFLNGAYELAENPSVYDNEGDSVYGHFSTYRTAWKDSSGYILRNDGVGPFFRLKSFYRTEGTLGNPVQNIRKLNDMVANPTKVEGQLTTLSTGLYFLNNSGSVSKYNDEDSTWRTGGPGANSLAFRNLQDSTVQGFDSPGNTLLVASDGDKKAYMSFDYSPNAFLLFNELDLTFKTLGPRPDGEQFNLGIY